MLFESWKDVNELQTILLIVLSVAVGVDLLNVAARASLSSFGFTRSRSQPGPEAGKSTTAASQITAPSHTRGSLKFALGLNRFIIAGLTLGIIYAGRAEALFSIQAGGILITSALILSLIEWIIEEQIAQRQDQWEMRLNGYVRFISIFFYPLLFLLEQVRSDRQAETGSSVVIEDELKTLVDAGQQEGLLEQEERKMIYSIFQLGETLAREIMVPRIDITALDLKLPLQQAVDQLMKSGFSRVPVYEDSVDNIQGLLYTKDLLRFWREGAQSKSLRELLRPAFFVPEAKKVDELLAEMQAHRVHMAIVVDEYGGVAGLVTLEDIVEEIVGEIRDEFDQAEESLYQQIGEREYIFLGRIDINDFNEIMSSDLSKEEAETLGGFIYNHVGRVPNIGETIQIDHLLLTVEQVSGRRIRKVRASWVPETVEESKEDDGAGR